MRTGPAWRWVLVFVAALIGAGRVQNDAQAEARAIEKLKKLGALIVVFDQSPGRPIHLIWSPAAPVAYGDWKLLEELANFKSAKLSLDHVTDNTLESLRNARSLQELDVNNTSITDAGLDNLKGLTSLQKLDLSYNQRLTDAGLEHLGALASLHQLDLNGLNFTGVCFSHFRGAANLEELDMYNSGLNDVGLKNIKGFTKLRMLSLGFTKVTDSGLAQLTGLPSLERLKD